MADDRGGAWKRLSADPRLRVDTFYSGQDVHRGTGTIRQLMEPPEKAGWFIDLVASSEVLS